MATTSWVVRLSMKFARNATHIALSQVFVGLVSYFTVFVAARVLDAENLARFSTTWALVNTIVLTTLIPIETYSPKLQAEFIDLPRSDLGSVDSALLVFSLAGGLASAVTIFFLTMFGILPINTSEFLAVVVFIVGATLYGFKRASAMSNGEFNKYWMLSLNYSAAGSIGLLVVYVMGKNNWSALLIMLGVASTTTLLIQTRGRRVARLGFLQVSVVVKQSHTFGTHKVLLRLLVATFLSLLLSNGAVAFGLRIGVDSYDLVAYSALLNIVLIPMTMLNSLSAPILNKAVRLVHSNQPKNLLSLYTKSVVVYVIAIFFMATATIIFGDLLLRIYVGSAYNISAPIAGVIAISEGIATLTVLPRLFLVASGESKSILRIWVLGICCFVVTLIIPVSPMHRIIFAPGIAGGIIVLTSSVLLWHKCVRSSNSSIL